MQALVLQSAALLVGTYLLGVLLARGARLFLARPRALPAIAAEAPAAVPPTARKDAPLAGILNMVGATVCFAAGTAITKWQLAKYPPGEVAFLRQAASLLFCAALILPMKGLAVFKTARPGQHAARGFTQFLSMMSLIIALTMLPLGAAMSISFSAPLFAVLYSVLFFGERVGIHRTAALLFGFVGVLLVTEPGPGGFQLGALFALANAMLYASVTVAVRRMSAKDSAETLTMYQMVFLTFWMGLLLPLGFVMPTLEDGAMLLGAGLINGIGQFWWTKSLQLAATSVVMPYYYLSLVWAMALGFVVFGEVPTIWLCAGAAVVMVSGLYLIWRERVAARRP